MFPPKQTDRQTDRHTGATTEELTRKVEELIEMPIITTSTELVVARLSIVSTPTIDKLGHLRPPGNYRNL